MSSALRLFTSESVTEGHPDKICDQISDSILDALLAEDPNARVAVETLVTTGLVHVAGEVTTTGYVEIPAIVRERITGHRLHLVRRLVRRSLVRRLGLDRRAVARHRPGRRQRLRDPQGTSTDELDQQGAGDQGIMFGYATTRDARAHADADLDRAPTRRAPRRGAHEGLVDFLRPDGKTQVTIGYEGAIPRTVDTVVLSTQHSPTVTQRRPASTRSSELVIDPVLETRDLDLVRRSSCSSTPPVASRSADRRATPGLTGRKIIVDTYGGAARHGGGAFSGKDPSKVDRSAAYAMRWVAKNAVAAGLADRLEVQVAYAIGKAAPVGLYVETFGTGHVPDERSSTRSARSSTCGPARSSGISTCCARSTRRPRPTATSAVSCPTSRGRRPTASTSCAPPSGL